MTSANEVPSTSTPKKFIACTYRRDGEDKWEPCDEIYWLASSEADQAKPRADLLSEIAEDEGGKVELRYEVWVEDPSYVLPGERAVWSLRYPEISEAATYDTAEEALQGLAEFEGGIQVEVTRLVLVHTYGHETVDVAAIADEDEADDEK